MTQTVQGIVQSQRPVTCIVRPRGTRGLARRFARGAHTRSRTRCEHTVRARSRARGRPRGGACDGAHVVVPAMALTWWCLRWRSHGGACRRACDGAYCHAHGDRVRDCFPCRERGTALCRALGGLSPRAPGPIVTQRSYRDTRLGKLSSDREFSVATENFENFIAT